MSKKVVNLFNQLMSNGQCSLSFKDKSLFNSLLNFLSKKSIANIKVVINNSFNVIMF